MRLASWRSFEYCTPAGSPVRSRSRAAEPRMHSSANFGQFGPFLWPIPPQWPQVSILVGMVKVMVFLQHKRRQQNARRKKWAGHADWKLTTIENNLTLSQSRRNTKISCFIQGSREEHIKVFDHVSMIRTRAATIFAWGSECTCPNSTIIGC